MTSEKINRALNDLRRPLLGGGGGGRLGSVAKRWSKRVRRRRAFEIRP